jgi:hypothetical protein
MKMIKLLLAVPAGLVLASAIPALAIEGLHISVQSSNAVLFWPSTNTETYIVQYRSNLNINTTWLTLTDYLSTASGTNITFFVHSNIVFGGGSTNQRTGFYRVVRDGAHLVGITNGITLAGTVTIPVEVANASGTISVMSLTENDDPVGDSIQTAPLSYPLALVVDTTQMSNGVHQISASAQWDDTNGGGWEAVSPPVTVNVNNEISFPNWMPFFGELGNSLLIWANSAHTNADWWIDTYDSHYAYVGTFAGHTDDGNIEGVWNLVGPYGESHTNDNFFIFVITTEYSGSYAMQNSSGSPVPLAGSGSTSTVSPKTYKRMEQWLGHGAWVAVAQHAWDNFINSDLLYAELSGFINAAKQAGWQVNPPPSQDDLGDWDAYALHFGSDPQADTDWQAFRNALYDPHSRNLVYFGHGAPNGLGADQGNPNRFISSAEIGNMLHTIPAGQTNSHSFRFVFLDGCSTAKGNLPEAFGMFHKENVDGSVYGAAAMRYSAFVGWPKVEAVGTGINNGQIDIAHVNFISHIQQAMQSGEGIKAAIQFAAAQFDTYGEFNENSMTVYGFWGETIWLDN